MPHPTDFPPPARITAALMLAGALSACALPPATAHVAPPPRSTLADIEVIDRSTGERLPIYWHQGRRYVAGAPGNRYSVAVRNRSGGRVLAVIAVDGVNAVSGETAAWDQRGYVFAPWQRYEVTGWRKSAEKIAAFEFTSLADAYATRTGRPDHVGVIGVALFREAPRVPPAALSQTPAPSSPASSPSARAESADTGRAAAGAVADVPASRADEAASDNAKASAEAPAREQRSRLGTGHGRTETSVVSFTDFERLRATPDEVITIHYDRRENLVALGVIPPPAFPQPRPLPQPFPGSLGFVADPPR